MYEHPDAGKKLERAIKRRTDFAECLKIVEFVDKYEIDGWNQWSIDGGPGDEMHEWVEDLSPRIFMEDDWDLDDDCELCKLIKNGAHSVGDFHEAAAKEKRKKAAKLATDDKLKKYPEKNDTSTGWNNSDRK